MTQSGSMALANQRIKTAWIMALVSGTVTLAFSIAALKGTVLGGVITVWSLIDVVAAYALAFGIFKKSRVAAVIMLIYYIIGQVSVIVTLQRPPSFLALIFVYAFFEGVRGTFAYHIIKKEQDEVPTDAPTQEDVTE